MLLRTSPTQPMWGMFVFFWTMQVFISGSLKTSAKLPLPTTALLQKDVEFNFNEEYKQAFDVLKKALTSAPLFKLLNEIYLSRSCVMPSTMLLGECLNRELKRSITWYTMLQGPWILLSATTPLWKRTPLCCFCFRKI